LRCVAPVAGRYRLFEQELLQRGVLLERARRRQIAVDRVIERRDVGRSLDRGVTTQGHDPSTGTAEVAEKQLQQRRAADDLWAVGVLRPGDRVGERARPLGTRVFEQRLRYGEEGLPGTAGDPLHHLGRVAAEVALENLEHAALVLQRLVTRDRRLHERRDQAIEGRTFLRGLAARRRALPGDLAGLGRVGGPGALGTLRPTARTLVLPRRGLVLADEAVVRPLGDPGARLGLESREHAVAVLGAPEVVRHDGARVRVVRQERFEERIRVPARILYDVVHHPAPARAVPSPPHR